MTAGLTFAPVTAANWADFAALFEARGGPKWCWCMAFRGAMTEKTDRPARRAAFERRVREGVPVGILAYDGGVPAGWVSVGPRESFHRIGGLQGPEAPGAVWSISCFYVPAARRRRGIADALVGAAADYARKAGASVLEAYPVAPDAPSYRHMGFVPQFRRLGFAEVGPEGRRRRIHRLAL